MANFLTEISHFVSSSYLPHDARDPEMIHFNRFQEASNTSSVYVRQSLNPFKCRRSAQTGALSECLKSVQESNGICVLWRPLSVMVSSPRPIRHADSNWAVLSILPAWCVPSHACKWRACLMLRPGRSLHSSRETLSQEVVAILHTGFVV